MAPSRLTVVRQGAPQPEPGAGETIVTTDELKRWIRRGAVLPRLFRWQEARLLTDRVTTMGRPLPAAIALRLLARGACYAEDATGAKRELTVPLLGRWAARLVTERFQRGVLLARVDGEVASLERALATPAEPVRLDLTKQPLYLRADVSFGVKAGGSVGHTAGVINHLGEFAAPPVVLTTDRVPMLRHGTEAHDIVPDEDFWNFRELPAFVMNQTVLRTAERVVRDRQLAFIYQRYTLNGYAAVRLARDRRVPLVTEYNGSEVWVARHWGQPLTHEALSRRIELLNLGAAHLVSVVSRALADEVESLGVERRRISVNPNGVDVDRYRPDVDGRGVRARYGLADERVIGFIGTFGPWHGAEVLAEAFVRLLAIESRYRKDVRLLWIGDGAGLSAVRQIVERGGASAACVFTGLVPQQEGAAYLAACDILVSPHVPNPDGTPFFGSPTKLFEYMATGRGIVASALDQIGEVLEDERTALLVPPGDVEALAAALKRLVDDPQLRTALGAQARRTAVARHTWREHVRKMLDDLQAVVGSSAARASAAR